MNKTANNIWACASLIALYAYFHPVYAEAKTLTCPPPEQVKAAKLIKAIQHPHDPTCWNLVSAPFRDQEGHEWNVTFGTFLPTAKTKEEAIKQGQAYFDKSPLLHQHPEPDEIINHITLCDYMPTGRLYWVSALNPPQYDAATRHAPTKPK